MRIRSYILIFICIFFISKTFAQKTYVLSVGIADYKEITDLRFTEEDVAVFNQIMAYHTNEVYALLGTEATHNNIVKTIRAIFAKATSLDTVIFFFSGHGYEGGFCCYDMHVQSFIGGLTYGELQILFRNCRAGKKMVFADACFSGGASKQRTALSVQTVKNADVMFFLSSRFDETSLELPKGPNGLFTYFLAKGLKGEADFDQDRIITIDEVYNFVYTNVVEYTTQVFHNQHPMIWGKFNKGMNVLNWN